MTRGSQENQEILLEGSFGYELRLSGADAFGKLTRAFSDRLGKDPGFASTLQSVAEQTKIRFNDKKEPGFLSEKLLGAWVGRAAENVLLDAKTIPDEADGARWIQLEHEVGRLEDAIGFTHKGNKKVVVDERLVHIIADPTGDTQKRIAESLDGVSASLGRAAVKTLPAVVIGEMLFTSCSPIVAPTTTPGETDNAPKITETAVATEILQSKYAAEVVDVTSLMKDPTTAAQIQGAYDIWVGLAKEISDLRAVTPRIWTLSINDNGPLIDEGVTLAQNEATGEVFVLDVITGTGPETKITVIQDQLFVEVVMGAGGQYKRVRYYYKEFDGSQTDVLQYDGDTQTFYYTMIDGNNVAVDGFAVFSGGIETKSAGGHMLALVPPQENFYTSLPEGATINMERGQIASAENILLYYLSNGKWEKSYSTQAFTPTPEETKVVVNLEQSLSDWISGKTVLLDETRFTEYGKPYPLKILGNVEPDYNDAVACHSLILGYKILDNHLLVFLGFEDINKNRFYVPFSLGPLSDQKSFFLDILQAGRIEGVNNLSAEKLSTNEMLQRLPTLIGWTIKTFVYTHEFSSTGHMPAEIVEEERLQTQSAKNLARFLYQTTLLSIYDITQPSLINSNPTMFDASAIPINVQFDLKP